MLGTIPGADTSIYHLFEQEVLEADDETRTVRAAMHMPDSPPSRAMFDAWVFQSINRSARDAYDEVITEATLAAKFDASYAVGSTLSSTFSD